MNNDVPIEAAFKQLLIENGKLKSEIEYLEHELELKTKAIDKFKEWQKKMAEFKAKEWLDEGIRLVAQGKENDKLRKQFKTLRNFIKNYDRYKMFVESFQKAYVEMMAAKEQFEKAFKDET